MIKLLHGECLEKMASLPDNSVDMVLCDLPYGTTACKWDTVIAFNPLWTQYKRICKGAVVLTAAQPFTSALVCSNIENFKYSWCWDKGNAIRNHLNAKHQPMRVKEDILVFYNKLKTYNPQYRAGSYKTRKTSPGQSESFGKVTGIDKNRLVTKLYPVDIICFDNQNTNTNLHPTQKPVALMEYLIRTYTNKGETVLDNTMGSGTTGIACINTERNFIGIEQDEVIFNVAKNRISEHLLNDPMF